MFGWTEIIHSIAPDSLPSQRVAQKLPAPFESDAVDICGQTRVDWRTR